MITNPDYRQDPWRESLRQALLVFDEVVVVCGDPEDPARVKQEFPDQPIVPVYLDWPQPEWTYDELARHLNFGLEKCRAMHADWVIKFDIDCLFHENSKSQFRQCLGAMKAHGDILAQFEKLQFFLVGRAYEKGKIPLGINMAFNVGYGVDKSRYTDLCQPIILSGDVVQYRQGKHPIPKGDPVPERKMKPTGIHVWNYDYSFKTYDRALELLYHFDRAHANWWGAGYHGRMLEDITPETAMAEYLALIKGRVEKCKKIFRPEDHPRFIQDRIRNIKPEEFGHSLWGKTEIPKL